MFRTAWTVGRVRGIPVRLHVSLLLIVPLITFSIASSQIPMKLHAMGVHPGQLTLPPAVLGLILALSVFVSIALHELGHALTSLAQGGRVRSITLMLLGGVTEIEHEEATPRQEFWMALAGPLVSFALAFLGFALARIPGLWVDAYVSLWLFGLINLFIALFNLLPAFPLDGGRLLRAGLQRWFSPVRATRIAANVGRVFALVGVGLGLMTGEFMLVLVGAFVFVGAMAEENAVRLRTGLNGLFARQAMVTRVVTVGPRMAVADAARHMLNNGAGAALVRDLAGTYGALAVEDLRGRDEPVASLVSGKPLVVEADADLGEVVLAMRRHRSAAIVRDDMNAIVGVITFSELGRALALRRLADAGRAAAERVSPVPGREDA